MLQAVEVDEPACLIEVDDVAHPARHRNVGDGVFVVHEPLPAGEMQRRAASEGKSLLVFSR